MAGDIKALLEGLVKGGMGQHLIYPYLQKQQARSEQNKLAVELEKEKYAQLGKMITEGMLELGEGGVLQKRQIPAGMARSKVTIGGEEYRQPEELVDIPISEYKKGEGLKQIGTFKAKPGTSPKIVTADPELVDKPILLLNEEGNIEEIGTYQGKPGTTPVIKSVPKTTPEFTPTQERTLEEKKNKVYGDWKEGTKKTGFLGLGGAKIETREDAVIYSMRSFGLDPEQYPDMKMKLDELFPPTKTEPKISTQERFNQKIKAGRTESQAYKELIDEGY